MHYVVLNRVPIKDTLLNLAYYEVNNHLEYYESFVNYRNPYQYNYVCSTTPSATFNHRFRNVHQIQSQIWHLKSNCSIEEISENEA